MLELREEGTDKERSRILSGAGQPALARVFPAPIRRLDSLGCRWAAKVKRGRWLLHASVSAPSNRSAWVRRLTTHSLAELTIGAR